MISLNWLFQSMIKFGFFIFIFSLKHLLNPGRSFLLLENRHDHGILVLCKIRPQGENLNITTNVQMSGKIKTTISTYNYIEYILDLI